MQRENIRNGELAIEYTSKALSGWGGLALFFEYLERVGFIEKLAAVVPEAKTSNNRVSGLDTMRTFLATVLVGGSRFAHVQRVCRDEVIRRITGAQRLGAEDTVRRFFRELKASASENLYTDLQSFASELMASHLCEDVLDLDSTILERYGEQEGVGKGYHTARHGQTSHHPLLAMFARAKHIPLVWLRAGGASTLRGAAQFVEELLARLPEGFRITALRADSGFYSEEYLRTFEDRGLRYIVPIRMHGPVKRFVASIANERWVRLDDAFEFVDLTHQFHGWARARRVIACRRILRSNSNGQLFNVPAYEYSALVTTLELPAAECIHFYDQRGECENTIKEFKNDFGARGFSLERFVGTEAALRIISILFNLVTEFKRTVLRNTSLTLNTVRTKVFVLGAMLGRAARQTILRLGVRHAKNTFSELLARAQSATYATAPQLSP